MDALPHRCGIRLRQRPQKGFAGQTEGGGQPQQVPFWRKAAAGDIRLNLMEVQPRALADPLAIRAGQEGEQPQVGHQGCPGHLDDRRHELRAGRDFAGQQRAERQLQPLSQTTEQVTLWQLSVSHHLRKGFRHREPRHTD